MTFAVEHLQKLYLEKKAQRLKQFFLFNNYDIRYIHSLVMFHRNVLVRVRESFAAMINKTIKLPGLVVILIDCDFVKFRGETQDSFEVTLAWLTSELFICMQARKGQIPDRCYRGSEPKFIFVKPVAKYNLMDVDDINQMRRRRALEIYTKRLKYFFTVNIEKIVPNDTSYFEILTGSLSVKGYEVFWKEVDEMIRKVDTD